MNLKIFFKSEKVDFLPNHEIDFQIYTIKFQFILSVYFKTREETSVSRYDDKLSGDWFLLLRLLYTKMVSYNEKIACGWAKF